MPPRRRPSAHAVASLVLGAYFFVPLAFMCVPGLPRVPLVGLEAPAPLPGWSWRAFGDGGLQRAIDTWFATNLGLRGFLVRSDNQLNFSLFGEASTTYGSRIVVGAENTLFEYFYVKDLYGENRHPAGSLAAVAKRLRAAQDLLAARGKRLLLLVSPIKPYILPERLGARWAPPAGARATTDYDVMLPMLRAEGVDVFDAAAFFETLKPSAAHPLFTKGGTHWSHYGACLAAAELVRRASELVGRPLSPVDCEDVELRRKPRVFDSDLAELLNVWTKRWRYEPLAYPKVTPRRIESERAPKALVIGSSFVWVMADYLSRAETFDELTFLYYYSSKYQFAGAKNRQVEWRRGRASREIEPYDIVILEAHQAALASVGSGFLGDLLRELRARRS